MHTSRTAATEISAPYSQPKSRRSVVHSKKNYNAFVDWMIPQARHTIRIYESVLSPEHNLSHRLKLYHRFLVSNPVNRLVVLVSDLQLVEQEQPRWLQFAKLFSHSCSIQEFSRKEGSWIDSFMTVDSQHFVLRLNHQHVRVIPGINNAFERYRSRASVPLHFYYTGL